MGRPQLPPGSHGAINVVATPQGYRARTRVRDHLGRTAPLERHGKSAAAATRALRTAVTERLAGGGGLAGDTRIAALAEHWLELDHDWASNTTRLYTLAARKHVIPSLGQLRIREVTVPTADRFLVNLTRSNGPGAAQTCRAVLNGMLGLAARQGIIPTNPIRDVSPIRAAPAKPAHALEVDEADRITDALRSSPQAVAWDLPDLVEFMLGTGLRIGEACALRWSAVDLGAGTAEINATVVRITGIGLVIQDKPKSRAGHRVLLLPPSIVAMLERRLTELQIESPHGVIFPSPRGGLRNGDANHELRESLKGVDGLGWVRFHTLRKTVATRLDEAGQSPRQIADQLGHAKASMTLDVYQGRKMVNPDAARILDR